jgi:hypothetical protein
MGRTGGVSGQAAAVFEDRIAQLAPQLAVHVARHNAEIVADINDHGAQRLAAQQSGSLLGRGQRHDTWGGLRLGTRDARAGRGWLAGRAQAEGRRREIAAAGGTPFEPFVERDGQHQAVGDEAEDGSEIGGSEGGAEDEGRRGAGALAKTVCKIVAIEDDPAEHVEEAANAAAILRRRLPGRRIWMGSWSGAGRLGGT